MKQIIGLCVCLCLIFSISFADTFSDLEGCWAKDDIELATSKGLFNGYNDGTFKPYKNIRRIEFIIVMNKILSQNCSLDGIDYKNAYMYPDVKPITWAIENYQQFMTRVNLYGSISDRNYGLEEIRNIFGDNFEPNKPITREEAVALIGLFVKDELKVNLDSGFSDIGTATFPQSIKLAKKIGITSGYPDGTFRPFRSISRAEATKMLLIFESLSNKLKEVNVSNENVAYIENLEPVEVLEKILEYEGKKEFYNAICFYDPWEIRDLGLSYLDYMKNPFLHACVEEEYLGSFTFETKKVSNTEVIVNYKSSLCDYTFSKTFKKMYGKWYASFETNMIK